jgi:hypothetical protein
MGADHCGNLTRRAVIDQVNMAVGDLAVVKCQHYILEMSQNYVCYMIGQLALTPSPPLKYKDTRN